VSNTIRFLVALTLAIAGAAFGPAILAQEPPPAPTPSPAPTPEEPETPETPPPAEVKPIEEPKPRHFGLFVAVGAGTGEAREFNTSIETFVTDRSISSLSLDEHDHVRAAIGWQLAEGKGDFRVAFTGFKETGYQFDASGEQTRVFNTAGGALERAAVPIRWWHVSIDGGTLRSERAVPTWEPALDANGNGAADPDEVVYLPADISFTRSVPDTLQNQIQSVDLLYGREFGGRRYSSHWWAGFRYSEYTGNIPAGGWFNTDSPGQGFTDGSFIRLLNLYQETKGWGPTGAWEVDFNFFNKGLVLYLRSQAVLSFNSLEADSGPFFTIVKDPFESTPQTAAARLNAKRDKSTWQNSGEFGVRVGFRNGLQLEAGYFINGYLDAVLMPSRITIPNLQQAHRGVSALYNSHDYIVDGWQANVAFQF
jgi:hypothetical protein